MIDPKPKTPGQVVIENGPHKGIYNVHPVARFFPLLQGDAYKELLASIREIGQQEPIVLDGSDFLDGRNRLAVLNDLKMEPLIVHFADLQTGLNPGVWIAAKNLERRHLTNDQYLAISARYFDWCQEEAKRNEDVGAATTNIQEDAAASPASGSNVGLTFDDYPQKPADNVKPRKRGRPRGQRSDAETLARKTKQTRYRAEQMLRIRAYSPELALKVEEGRMSVKEAAAQIAKAAPAPGHDKEPTNADVPSRPPDSAKIDRAAIRTVDGARRAASKLRKIEQPLFWERIIGRAQEIMHFEFPSGAAAENESASPSSSEVQPAD